MPGSKEINKINNSDCYDTYRNLYGAWVKRSVKRSCVKDGAAMKVSIKENAIKRTFGKRLTFFLDCDFFTHPVYLYRFREDLIVKIELNYSEKVILCSRENAATYKLLDISWEYDAIFDEHYVTLIGEIHAVTASVPHTKATLIHYHTLYKKGTTWKNEFNNPYVCSLQR